MNVIGCRLLFVTRIKLVSLDYLRQINPNGSELVDEPGRKDLHLTAVRVENNDALENMVTTDFEFLLDSVFSGFQVGLRGKA